VPSHFDTIVAPITGTGPSPVAIVRLSGPESWKIAQSLIVSQPHELLPRYAHYTSYRTGDDGYLILFEEGRSYTGELSAELSIHGSRASVSALLEAAIALGARFAEPGEFTQRAFLHGRIDLTEAEAVRDTIEAATQSQMRLANAMREGALHREVSSLADELIGVLAAIEASVDFSEEIGDVEPAALSNRIDRVVLGIEDLLATAEYGRIIRSGLRIAIVGPPNAGKSSLLNLLLKNDRSIVTEIPGTTRDYVEEQADFRGFPIVLIDTAGLRETNDPVETIGVQRARSIAANADLVWFVSDVRENVLQPDWEFDRPVVWIANKIDLAPCPPDFVGISCITGEGIDRLVQTAVDRFDDPRGLAIQPRHEPEFRAAHQDLSLAADVLKHGRPADLAAVGIRAAIQSLGRITGETADADIIARIFSDFCIGK
jgi:tRNA modification GTPase